MILTPKRYWSIKKHFTVVHKVLIFPPLLINNKLISDFEVKANYFNDFLTIAKFLNFLLNTKLSSVKFESKDISNIRSLDISKAHGHDNISIRMLKKCDSAIVEPLTIIFSSYINQSMFPEIWKKNKYVSYS